MRQFLLFLFFLSFIQGFVWNSNGGGLRQPPRGPPTRRDGALFSESPEPSPMNDKLFFARNKDWNETFAIDQDGDGLLSASTRGGSQQQQQRQQQQQLPVTEVVKGTQATLSATTSFWGRTFGKVINGVKQNVANVGSKISNRFKSPEKRKEEELLEQLQTMPVQRVVVKDSQVLPKEVVQIATRRAGLLGQPLRTERVQELARTLKQWYDRQGYVLHSVTGATLETSTATAEIQVQEPLSSTKPVNIIFCKEMVVDSETGELLTMRQYKDRYAVKRKFGAIRERRNDDKLQVNTTLIETDGRTNPSRIASALGLRPHRPFQWNPQRWQSIVRSGIFTRVVRATPQPLSDGTVQLNIVAQEAPTRHLEYGLGKSLYTGSWEGELDFEHANLLGGGEVVGLSVRRGTRDAEPSVRVRFTDDRFGLEGGYDVEAFSDYIGDPTEEQPGEVTVQVADMATHPNPLPSPTAAKPETDDLFCRRGATFRLRNPFNPEVIRNSMVSASIERTSTQTGLHENIGSATLKLGPFRRALPLDALSSVDTAFTTGTRLVDLTSDGRDSESKRSSSFDLKPYASFTATTKQIVPLLETRTRGNRPLILALQHSATVASPNLPRHEAKAQGVANNIRGAKNNGGVSSAIRGTTEVRIPVDLPMLPSRDQDTSLVLFGDWLFATKDSTSPIFRKSSVGVGIRKNLQGLPLHCNFCYTGEGKVKTLFGLGRDFEA